MIDVTRQSTAPADRLWAVLSDVRRWPQWLPTVDAVTPHEPDRADEVGASYTVEQPGMPRAVWTMTDIDPGRSFTWESVRPGIRTVGTHTLTPGPDGSTTIGLAIQWSGFLAPLIRLTLGRKSLDYVTREAAALDSTAKAAEPATGA
ncbi:MAG: SRPBCC family protein [Ornithinibacter sp.]